MVHTGRPSRGCDVCRKRRIKCDEREPSCSYCLKRQVTCPGYKSHFDLAWRDQNQVAQKSVQRRKNASDNAERHKEKQQLKLFSPDFVPRVLPQDTTGYALDFFFTFYICLPQDQDVQRGFLECLYPIWMRSSSTSPLRPVVTAVASLMLDAWSQVKPDRPHSLSRSQYAQGVAALRETLESDEDAGDDIIMAGLMLIMYENILSFLTATPNRGPHITGTTAMIESRRRNPVADETSQRMILGTRSQVVVNALSSAESVPPVIATWSDMTTDIPTTPGFRLDALNIEIADLRALASRLTQSKEIRKDLAFSTLEQATELDLQLSTWTENLPMDWTPTRVSGPKCIPQSVQDAGLYQDYCDIYKSIFVADTFNGYYSSRIKLQLTIVTCLELLDSDTSSISVAAALGVIQDLADSICASIPFHLGDRTAPGRIDDTDVRFPYVGGNPLPEGHHAASGAFGGFLLCRQLPELLSPSIPLRFGQKQWLGGQLGRIRRAYTIRAS